MGCIVEPRTWNTGGMAISEQIVCVDCGGTAYLIQPIGPDDLPAVGDVVSYRCGDCLDRWDVELTEEDIAESAETPGGF